MARPKNDFPNPALRLKDGIWRIYWSWERKIFEFSTGYRENEKQHAESASLQTALTLRGASDWPAWAEVVPTIQRWREKDTATASQGASDSAAALEAWKNHYAASVERAKQIQARYKEVAILASRYNLLTLTSDQAASFVQSLSIRPARYYSDHVAATMGNRTLSRPEIIKALETAGVEVDRKRLATALVNRNVFELIAEPGHHRTGKYRVRKEGRKLAPRTRNDYLIACGMFYKWAVAQGLVKINPFDGIKRAREDHNAEIIWLTRDERDAITRASESVAGRLPIWIALYAGLRLGEIARLRWEDIDLRQRWIHVKKSKTGKTRRVPISEALLSALHRGEDPTGFVCPHWQVGDYHGKADSDLLAIRKSLPELSDKLRWNIFRHTFASLLAQTGKVSIDQISALMGNTPEVCRRHYAHLVPDAAERTGIDLID